MRALARRLDYRTWLAFSLAIVIATGALSIQSTLRQREIDARNVHDALVGLRAIEANQRDERAKTDARISELDDRIAALTRQLLAEEQANSAQAAYTARQIQILTDQVRRMNGRPIIVTPPPSSTTTTSTTRPPPPSTTTTTRELIHVEVHC